MPPQNSPKALHLHSRRPILSHQIRTFTTTPRRHRNGPVPKFHPTQSHSLALLLSTLRKKVFLPAHLKRPQQNLIYRTKYRATLQSEPFEVDVGPPGAAEKFALEPIDRTKDVPDGWKSLLEAMRLMGESRRNAVSAAAAEKKAREQGDVAADETAVEEDAVDGGARRDEYNNLIPLLAGLRITGRKWKTWQWERIVRTVGEHDAVFALLEAARQAERTGFYLHHIRVVREVVWACRAHAVKNAWDAASCAKALRYLEEFARAMEDPIQRREQIRAVNKGELNRKLNVLAQADVIGVAVELAAKRVEAVIKEGVDDDEVVKSSREKLEGYLARLLPNVNRAAHEDHASAEEGMSRGAAADYELLRWAPVLHGLVTAEKTNSGGVIGNFRVHIESYQEQFRAWRDTAKGASSGRGLSRCQETQLI